MHGGLILQGFPASESQLQEDSSLFLATNYYAKEEVAGYMAGRSGERKGGRRKERGVHVSSDLFGDYRDGSSDRQQQRQQRGVVMLSVTLGCVTQAGWMPLSTASCLNEEAYGCTRTSAYFMNI